MKRRAFLKRISVSTGISIGIPKLAFSKTNSQLLKQNFLTAYTYPVGKVVINQNYKYTERVLLSVKINSWIQESNSACINGLNALITKDVLSNNFCEIEGWVITQAEAFLSAEIISPVYSNGD